MTSPKSASARRSGIPNILKNLTWLLGGKGFGAVCSLVYLALLSRSLGLKDFGHFSLIFGTGQALVAIAGFQTWQTMIRFGARPSVEKDWARFGRLAWLCGSIDVGSALTGSAIAVVVYYGFGDMLGINPAYTAMAFAFNVALLWSRMSTPSGIVRVLNRFDISSLVEGFVPLARLVAAFGLVMLGPSVGRFLLAWAIIDLLSAVIYWLAAYRLAPHALRWLNFGKFRQSLQENSGLTQFIGITYLSATLETLYKQGPLLIVGYLMGTSAAGLYRLADQVAQGIGKLSGLIGQVIFPEFAVTRAAHGIGTFRKLVRQITVVAGVGGLAVTVLAWAAGGTLLEFIGGEDFRVGAAVLLPLAIAASFELASVAYEPVLFATGHARYPLYARAFSVLILATGIMALSDDGPVGIGWAVALGLALGYVALSIIVRLTLRSLTKSSES